MRLVAAVFLCSMAWADIPSAYKSTVLVVQNDATPSESGTGATGASAYVAAHYMSVRGIPNSNLCHISYRGDLAPQAYDAWDISYSDYVTYVLNPITSCINALGGTTAIRFIVNTYGVPSNILVYQNNYEMSIDSMLAYSAAATRCQTIGAFFQCGNTYGGTYNSVKPRIWNFEGSTSSYPFFYYRPYIVARLDGPTAVLAAALVDKAVAAESALNRRSGIGYFDWQGVQPSGNSNDGSMKRAYDLCVAAGMQCVLNNQSSSGGLISSAPNTLWAWGWYSGASVNNVYTFVPGAVGSQLTSYAANCIRVNCTGSYAPYWITAGITAFWGPTGEPSSDVVKGDNLLAHLWAGYTLGESFYIASATLGWMGVLIGDPLYTPNLTGPTTIQGRGGFTATIH